MSDKCYGEILAIVSTAVVSRPLKHWEVFFSRRVNVHVENSPFCKCDSCYGQGGVLHTDERVMKEWTSSFLDLYAVDMGKKRDTYNVGRLAEVSEGLLKVRKHLCSYKFEYLQM